MKTIMYVGPQRPGVVISPTSQFAEYQAPVTITDDDLARRLLEQAVWEEVKTMKAEVAPPAMKKEEK